MSTAQNEVFEAFRDLGIAVDRAMRAASVLSRQDENMVTIASEIAALRRERDNAKDEITAIKADTGSLGGDIVLLRWLLLAAVASNAVILLKVFLL